MTSHAELIQSCLELVAEKTDDLAPAVYQRFFAIHPEAEVLFGNDPDDYTKGSMIVSLLMEILSFAEGIKYVGSLERWIDDHRAYGVTLPMYQAMFDCLEAAIRDVIGAQWAEEMDSAWRAQFAKLQNYLHKIYEVDAAALPAR